MAIDNDLSALLPDPPPPRPARREATIEEALRRFDGGSQQAPAKARPEPARGGWGRPQVAALASVALVVLVSVPIWWTGRDRIIPQASPSAAASPVVAAPAPAPAAPQQPARVAQATAAEVEPGAPPSPAAIRSNLDQLPQFAPEPVTATGPAEAPAVRETNLSRLPVAPPAAPAQRAAAGRAEAEAEADAGQRIVVTGSRIQRQDYNSTTPMVTVNEEVRQASLDWSACTLLDPRRDVDACRASADPAVRGARGRAGAQLADGLTLAWQGDLDRAIAAFGRAIDTAPDLSIAYLNRGLAYQQKGDLRRALADLDRAVAADPRDGRGYYHRSQLQRARGNTERADADARRAAQLRRD